MSLVVVGHGPPRPGFIGRLGWVRSRAWTWVFSSKLNTADRKAGVLRVDAIHRDVAFDKTMAAAVNDEIKDLASWLELDLQMAS